MVDWKSIPSYKESISRYACVLEDNVRFARSHDVRSRRKALLSPLKSLRFLRLNSDTKWLTIRLSKSSPPKCVSPAVAFTSKIPSSIDKMDTSNVPPPQSKINTFCSPPVFLSKPYAIAAAVGSLIIRNTSNPAIAPASLVDCLCASLKYAGTVITAFVTSSPKYVSAISFILINTILEISSAVNSFSSCLYLTRIIGLLSFPLKTSKGQFFISSCTALSPNLRPINRLASNTVFSGFVDAWFLAALPISLSVSLNAT